MTARPDIFTPKNGVYVLRLVLEHPLAWVVSDAGGEFHAAPLPLRPRVVRDGRIEAFEGHLSRANPLCAALRRDARALLLFSGPQGYISPSWVSNRTWAPTWNYAVAQFLVNVSIDESPERLDAHLDDLVETMERGRPGAWQISEMGERYGKLKQHIVPFEAKVVELRARFKLGQDERDAEFREITEALARTGAVELLEWMRDQNRGR